VFRGSRRTPAAAVGEVGDESGLRSAVGASRESRSLSGDSLAFTESASKYVVGSRDGTGEAQCAPQVDHRARRRRDPETSADDRFSVRNVVAHDQPGGPRATSGRDDVNGGRPCLGEGHPPHRCGGGVGEHLARFGVAPQCGGMHQCRVAGLWGQAVPFRGGVRTPWRTCTHPLAPLWSMRAGSMPRRRRSAPSRRVSGRKASTALGQARRQPATPPVMNSRCFHRPRWTLSHRRRDPSGAHPQQRRPRGSALLTRVCAGEGVPRNPGCPETG
jgi:hypothetical protein